MVEAGSSEKHERIPPGQTLLFSEPIFKFSEEELREVQSFVVPAGTESWVEGLPLESRENERAYKTEYLAIAKGLKDMGVPYRVIIAHRELLDMPFVLGFMTRLGVRGLGLSPQIPYTSFPRDFMVNFDGLVYLNPEANIKFPDGSGTFSPLGEGGRVLKSGKKVLIPDPNGFREHAGQISRHAAKLSDVFRVGQIPHPVAIDIIPETGEKNVFTNSHLDRVSALVKGQDGKDYLVMEESYAASETPRVGKYWPIIQRTCRDLEIEPVVVTQTADSIPGRMNMVQFADRSVLLTGGDESLENIVAEIVGRDNTYTTETPIVNYPLFRKGGIRCMTLFAPDKIVGQPLVRQ